uniref:Retrotransposon protein, putative, Ty1-copia subclass n=1 Tax=Oryza sativa subsp. japonica TaxID=39947 RepID=Q2QNC5_ORYSJ|nr:retrotransposon protein, putative, Ty1-copia subclass [Oryza sativa Japonica Group]
MMYRDMPENNTTSNPGAMVLGVSPDKGYKFQITTKYTTNIRRVEVSEKAEESGGYSLMGCIKDIPTLKGDNYAEWKRKLDLAFILGEVDWVLTTPCPIEPAELIRGENESDADWQKRQRDNAPLVMSYDIEQKKWSLANKKCLAVVKNTIEPTILGSIPECDAVSDYLERIKSQFTGSSKTYATQLIKQLVTERYHGGGVRDHILRMSNMASKLKPMDLGITDDFMVHLVMASLPKQFDNFIVNYNISPEKWKFEKLIANCVQEEERIKESNGGSINYVKDNKKKNHKSPTSKAKQSQHLLQQQYKKTGHYKKDCPDFLKMIMARKGENIITFVNESHYVGYSRSTWWIDSGATIHACNCLKAFRSTRTTQRRESSIRVANGVEEKVEAVGDLPLEIANGFTLLLRDVFYVPSLQRNLISVSKLDFDGYDCRFGSGKCELCVDGYDSFITFTDDYSRYGYIYTIKERSEALDKFKIFKAEDENQHDIKIKVVRSDRGGEYYGRHTPYGQVPGPFARFLLENGIVAQYSTPGEPQQNGVAERRNRTLMYMAPRRSERVRRSAIRDDYKVYNIEESHMEDDPTSYEEAMRSARLSEWLEAMKDEMKSMKLNDVWDLEEIPKGAKIVGYGCKNDISKWRFGGKSIHGATERFCHERKRKYGMPSKRSIYGLKQASRQWYLKFDGTIKKFGFQENVEDNCIYSKFKNGRFIFLILYVDDILLASSDVSLLQETKKFLSSNFDMKDLGEASYVLGIEIHRDKTKYALGLSQKTYRKGVEEIQHEQMQCYTCSYSQRGKVWGIAMSQKSI